MFDTLDRKQMRAIILWKREEKINIVDMFIYTYNCIFHPLIFTVNYSILTSVQDTGDCPGLPILSRNTWGAANAKATEKLSLPVKMFFIHHTEMGHCDNTESCSAVMRSIQTFHMKDRGGGHICFLRTVIHNLDLFYVHVML
jgi:hypothetical protein